MSGPDGPDRTGGLGRPREEWRDLPPISGVLAPPATATGSRQFVRALPSRWQQPPALGVLGHRVGLGVPGGLVSGVARALSPTTPTPSPWSGPDADLVWPAVPPAPHVPPASGVPSGALPSQGWTSAGAGGAVAASVPAVGRPGAPGGTGPAAVRAQAVPAGPGAPVAVSAQPPPSPLDDVGDAGDGGDAGSERVGPDGRWTPPAPSWAGGLVPAPAGSDAPTDAAGDDPPAGSAAGAAQPDRSDGDGAPPAGDPGTPTGTDTGTDHGADVGAGPDAEPADSVVDAEFDRAAPPGPAPDTPRPRARPARRTRLGPALTPGSATDAVPALPATEPSVDPSAEPPVDPSAAGAVPVVDSDPAPRAAPDAAPASDPPAGPPPPPRSSGPPGPPAPGASPPVGRPPAARQVVAERAAPGSAPAPSAGSAPLVSRRALVPPYRPLPSRGTGGADGAGDAGALYRYPPSEPGSAEPFPVAGRPPTGTRAGGGTPPAAGWSGPPEPPTDVPALPPAWPAGPAAPPPGPAALPPVAALLSDLPSVLSDLSPSAPARSVAAAPPPTRPGWADAGSPAPWHGTPTPGPRPVPSVGGIVTAAAGALAEATHVTDPDPTHPTHPNASSSPDGPDGPDGPHDGGAYLPDPAGRVGPATGTPAGAAPTRSADDGDGDPQRDDPAALDRLTRQIYGRLRSQLAADLLVDRERAQLLTDLT